MWRIIEKHVKNDKTTRGSEGGKKKEVRRNESEGAKCEVR
jgi:hypothetical protein